MKAFIALSTATLSLVSSISMACSPAEAEYIGQVTAVKRVQTAQGLKCLVNVGEFTFFQESLVCGLNESEAQRVDIVDPSCSLNVGDPKSEVLSVETTEL